jgi:hypothetical protein
MLRGIFLLSCALSLGATKSHGGSLPQKPKCRIEIQNFKEDFFFPDSGVKMKLIGEKACAQFPRSSYEVERAQIEMSRYGIVFMKGKAPSAIISESDQRIFLFYPEWERPGSPVLQKAHLSNDPVSFSFKSGVLKSPSGLYLSLKDPHSPDLKYLSNL